MQNAKFDIYILGYSFFGGFNQNPYTEIPLYKVPNLLLKDCLMNMELETQMKGRDIV